MSKKNIFAALLISAASTLVYSAESDKLGASGFNGVHNLNIGSLQKYSSVARAFARDKGVEDTAKVKLVADALKAGNLTDDSLIPITRAITKGYTFKDKKVTFSLPDSVKLHTDVNKADFEKAAAKSYRNFLNFNKILESAESSIKVEEAEKTAAEEAKRAAAEEAKKTAAGTKKHSETKFDFKEGYTDKAAAESHIASIETDEYVEDIDSKLRTAIKQMYDNANMPYYAESKVNDAAILENSVVGYLAAINDYNIKFSAIINLFNEKVSSQEKDHTAKLAAVMQRISDQEKDHTAKLAAIMKEKDEAVEDADFATAETVALNRRILALEQQLVAAGGKVKKITKPVDPTKPGDPGDKFVPVAIKLKDVVRAYNKKADIKLSAPKFRDKFGLTGNTVNTKEGWESINKIVDLNNYLK